MAFFIPITIQDVQLLAVPDLSRTGNSIPPSVLAQVFPSPGVADPSFLPKIFCLNLGIADGTTEYTPFSLDNEATHVSLGLLTLAAHNACLYVRSRVLAISSPTSPPVPFLFLGDDQATTVVTRMANGPSHTSSFPCRPSQQPSVIDPEEPISSRRRLAINFNNAPPTQAQISPYIPPDFTLPHFPSCSASRVSPRTELPLSQVTDGTSSDTSADSFETASLPRSTPSSPARLTPECPMDQLSIDHRRSGSTSSQSPPSSSPLIPEVLEQPLDFSPEPQFLEF